VTILCIRGFCDFVLLVGLLAGGQLYYQPDVVGLNLCVMCGAAAPESAAFYAAVYDYIPLFRVGQGTDRLHQPAAATGAVAGEVVDMQRPEAKGAVIPRGVAERPDFCPASGADKAGVIFGKALGFHICPPGLPAVK